MNIEVSINGAPAGVYDFKVLKLTPKERLRKSIQIFLVFFIAALISILIPVLHFFSVPVLILMSLILSIKKYNEVASMEVQGFKCPQCQSEFSTLKASWTKKYEATRVHCAECRGQISLEPEES